MNGGCRWGAEAGETTARERDGAAAARRTSPRVPPMVSGAELLRHAPPFWGLLARWQFSGSGTEAARVDEAGRKEGICLSSIVTLVTLGSVTPCGFREADDADVSLQDKA